MSFQGLIDDTTRNAAGAAMKAFFSGIGKYLPSAVNITFLPAVQEFDIQTGQLLGEVNMTTVPTVLTGTAGTGPYAGGSGFSVFWKTSLIYAGRRVQGRTYLVPAAACFDTDGTLTSQAVTDIQTAANGLVAASADFSIWSKLMSKPTDGTKPTQIGGSVASVSSAIVRDQAAQLRSRRT